MIDLWLNKIMNKNVVKYEKIENFKTRFSFKVVYCSTLTKNIAYFHLTKKASYELVFPYF